MISLVPMNEIHLIVCLTFDKIVLDITLTIPYNNSIWRNI